MINTLLSLSENDSVALVVGNKITEAIGDLFHYKSALLMKIHPKLIKRNHFRRYCKILIKNNHEIDILDFFELYKFVQMMSIKHMVFDEFPLC